MKYAAPLILLLLFFKNISAQDTNALKADKYFTQAVRLNASGQFLESNQEIEKALPVYIKENKWSRQAECYHILSQNFLGSSQLQKALEAAEKALHICRTKPDKYGMIEADALTDISAIHYTSGKYDSALVYLHKALPIRKKIVREDDPSITECYDAIGLVWFQKGNYEKAIEYVNRAIKLNIQARGEDQLPLGSNYNDLGVVYENKGDFDLALTYQMKALSIGLKRLGEFHPHISVAYGNISKIYRRLGDLKHALYYQRAALRIKLKLHGEIDLSTANSYISMGVLNRLAGNYDSALFFLRKSLSINKKLLPPDAQPLAPCYKNLGDVYENLGQYDSAIIYHRKSIAILEKTFGKKHPIIANDFNSVGNDFEKKGDYQSSLENFQQSLIANIINFNNTDYTQNPNLENYLEPTYLVQALTNKGRALQNIYGVKKDIKYLNLALQSYLKADTLIQNVRQAHRSQADKITFGRIAVQNYEGAIQASMLLFETTRNAKYAELMFYFCEKSKAGSLRETLSGIAANAFGDVPAGPQSLEKTLGDKINTLRSKIQKEKLSQNDTAKLRKLESELFVVNRSHDSLIIALEKNFPQYYAMKYNNSVISLKDLQQNLNSGTGIIEYFTGEKNIYVFTIGHEVFQYQKIKNDSMLNYLVTQLRSALNPKRALKNASQSYSNFTGGSFALYQRYLENALKPIQEKKKLIIISDGLLEYIPFDIILSENANSAAPDYSTLNYLLNKYSISYAYSSTILFEVQTRQAVNKNDFIAFAPEYNREKKDTIEYLALGRFRDQVTTLSWNKPEVTNINKYFSGTALFGNDASEKIFKSSANDHGIIHLAMHALIDDEKPMNSKLLFTTVADSIEDGYLNAYELYNMKLKANLVVLSACETGFGKMEKGEGIMSLGRAFAYAGCPSVVMSHWVVDDEATSQLMNYFYKNLAEGLNKDEALQKAKIEFLKNAHPLKQNPAYWAGFVVLGNTDPVTQSQSTYLLFGSITAAFVVLIIWIFVQRRRARIS